MRLSILSPYLITKLVELVGVGLATKGAYPAIFLRSYSDIYLFQYNTYLEQLKVIDGSLDHKCILNRPLKIRQHFMKIGN